MRRKSFALLLIFMIVFSTAGCGCNNAKKEAGDRQPLNTAVPENDMDESDSNDNTDENIEESTEEENK